MINKPIQSSEIFNRNICLKDTRTGSKLIDGVLDTLIASVENHYTLKSITEFLHVYQSKCENIDIANAEYERYIKVIINLSKYHYSNLAEEATFFFIDKILPYIVNLNRVLEICDLLKNKEERLISIIQDKAYRYRICDTILKNHDKIKSRFNIDNIARRRLSSGDFKLFCRRICSIVDTFSGDPVVKIELTFREIIYISYLYGMEYSEEFMVKYVVEYFLSVFNVDIPFDKYIEVILKSKMISYYADAKVQYLYHDNTKTILEHIKYRYYKEMPHNEKDFIDKLDFNKFDTNNLIKDMDSIFEFIRDSLVDFLNIENPKDFLYRLFNPIMDYFNNSNKLPQKNNLFKDRLLQKFINEQSYVAKHEYYSYIENIYEIYLEVLSDMTESMIKNMADNPIVEEDPVAESTEVIESSKLSKYKLNSLINDSKEAGEFIDKILKDEKVYKKEDEQDDIINFDYICHLDNDNRICINIRSFDMDEDISKINEITDYVRKMCNEKFKKSDIYITRNIHENSIEFNAVSKFEILTSPKEDLIRENNFTKSDMAKIVKLNNYLEILSNLQESNKINNIIVYLKDENTLYNMNKDTLLSIMEVWSYGCPIDSDYIISLIEDYVSYNKNKNSYNLDAMEVERKYKTFAVNENADINTQLETIDMLSSIVSKPLNEGVDLNSLKLAMMGFKKKIKDLGAKEKEMSRDLDMNFNNLIRGIQNAQSANRRESIIKGQVNTSLSKIIKIGIALAAAGVAAGSVVLPAVAAVTGIVLSKKATNKERQMVIDEIDIELKVLERELKNAEDNGSRKKYRTLLTYQRNLQREKQRILYRLSSKTHSIITNTKPSAGIGGDD